MYIDRPTHYNAYKVVILYAIPSRVVATQVTLNSSSRPSLFKSGFFSSPCQWIEGVKRQTVYFYIFSHMPNFA